jgi:hypothetical protein
MAERSPMSTIDRRFISSRNSAGNKGNASKRKTKDEERIDDATQIYSAIFPIRNG